MQVDLLNGWLGEHLLKVCLLGVIEGHRRLVDTPVVLLVKLLEVIWFDDVLESGVGEMRDLGKFSYQFNFWVSFAIASSFPSASVFHVLVFALRKGLDRSIRVCWRAVKR